MDKLEYLTNQFADIGLPYHFLERPVNGENLYFVGEITENPTETEDGAEESTMLLTGYFRGQGGAAVLSEYKNRIKQHFPANFGHRGRTGEGAICIFYDGSFFLPSVESELKRIQINIKIKEWKGE